LNSNGRGKEKRARREVTRPEPTIYGNCDSWSFIVGKKPRAYSRVRGQKGTLRTSNRSFIHKLSTKWMSNWRDNLWAICGSVVNHMNPSRIVVADLFDMPPIADEVPGFYPKTALALKKVSDRPHRNTVLGSEKYLCAPSFSGPRRWKGPKPEYGMGP
jgi:hypothetical protein